MSLGEDRKYSLVGARPAPFGKGGPHTGRRRRWARFLGLKGVPFLRPCPNRKGPPAGHLSP